MLLSGFSLVEKDVTLQINFKNYILLKYAGYSRVLKPL